MDQVLLLVSKSKGRAQLLRDAGIAFEVVDHKSDENVDRTGLNVHELACAIAMDKMEKVVFPEFVKSGNNIFAFSADTFVQTPEGEIFEKPKDEEDAVRMLKVLAKAPFDVFTGCCLRKFRPSSDGWQVEQTKQFVGYSQISYKIPEKLIDWYFSVVPDFLKISSAATIEGPGAQFTEWIKGSYTSIQGIPVFELRQELEAMGFFQKKDFRQEEANQS